MNEPAEVMEGQIWFHTRDGSRYRIVGLPYNALTDTIDVLYQPLHLCTRRYFTRQLTGHPKAWLSLNDSGRPRFQFEKVG